MAITLKNLEQDTLVALQYFWHSRGLARKKQAALGRSDQGERAGVTAGKNMQGFADLITRVVLANGLPPTSIQVSPLHRRRRAKFTAGCRQS